jgi:hypothetical protein
MTTGRLTSLNDSTTLLLCPPLISTSYGSSGFWFFGDCMGYYARKIRLRPDGSIYGSFSPSLPLCVLALIPSEGYQLVALLRLIQEIWVAWGSSIPIKMVARTSRITPKRDLSGKAHSAWIGHEKIAFCQLVPTRLTNMGLRIKPLFFGSGYVTISSLFYDKVYFMNVLFIQ